MMKNRHLSSKVITLAPVSNVHVLVFLFCLKKYLFSSIMKIIGSFYKEDRWSVDSVSCVAKISYGEWHIQILRNTLTRRPGQRKAHGATVRPG
jgi:hypothetical protein